MIFYSLNVVVANFSIKKSVMLSNLAAVANGLVNYPRNNYNHHLLIRVALS